MSKCLDKNISNFDHFLILGDLNSLMSEKEMKDFCDMHDLDNLIEEPSSMDVILTNTKNIFHNSIALENWDFSSSQNGYYGDEDIFRETIAYYYKL